MNALLYVNGEDVSEAALLEETKLNSDSSKRITTGNITLMGLAPDKLARYDDAFYDVDYYALDIRELYPVTIRDGRDGQTKLFDGYVMAMDMKQTDANSPQVFYQCDIADHAIWLDRSVCWDSSYTVTMPCSDQALITALVAHFCPNVNSVVHIGMLLPTIMQYDWLGKTCRQVLDDVASMSGGEWRVDFDGYVWYGAAANAPNAPFALSTTPDYVTTFPVRVDSFKRDFNNPVNRCFVRGAIDGTGLPVEAEYADPVSIDEYGEFAYSLVDDQTTTSYDAELRAKTTVLKYAWPLETGTFTVWKDDLKCGMRVSINEDWLGIDGDYTIRQLSLEWKDKETVEYRASFGAAQPDLETYLRLLDQRSKWKTSAPSYSVPIPGSVTDDSIADGGLHEGSITTVSSGAIVGLIQAGQIGGVFATTITGQISSGQIGSVSAGVIVGLVQSGQIGSVGAGVIQGAINAGQIGSVNATVIQGVVVTEQLANGIIDDLAKYATALRPVKIVKSGEAIPPMPNDNYPPNSYFYYEDSGHFYQMNSVGSYWDDRGTDPDQLSGQMSFYTIGRLSAKNITGLIIAAQIGSITAGQITGQIQAAQIGSVTASTIQGGIVSSQITSVNASAISGAISSSQITSISADKISGTISAGQIGSVNATTITIGLIQDGQISTLNGVKITAGSIDSSKLYADNITVGGGSGHPGKVNVHDGADQLTAQVGTLTTGQYGGWFKVFGAGGTNYTTAKVYTDISGNLYVNEANFTINNGTSQIKATPATFDATYNSLSVNVTQTNECAMHVSRGLVIKYGTSTGQTIGAFVRHPNYVDGTELSMYNGTTITILADSKTGKIECAGYAIRGVGVGLTQSVTISGTKLNFTGGLFMGVG